MEIIEPIVLWGRRPDSGGPWVGFGKGGRASPGLGVVSFARSMILGPGRGLGLRTLKR